MTELVYLVPLLPLLGFITLLVAGRRLGEPMAGWLATAAIGGSFLAAVGTWVGLIGLDEHDRRVTHTVFEWVPVGDFSVDVGFLVDPLSVAMVLFVTGIGTLIHLYSIGYMHGDANFSKFFLYLNLFAFSMLMLVLGDNLLLTFLGWEGVGACSYFLISFWFEEEANATAGKKAFVTNRVGDWGFMVATFLAFATIGSINYLDIDAAVADHAVSGSVATGLALLIFVGAMGKSAQFPLYLWLPDAMAGPTPVSALIHAATMVTSGVYLLTRINSVLHDAGWANDVIAWVGVGTALFAATIAVAQNDIKKVLAYSTVSQLGYMILAVGVGAYVAAIFHMITHAFFKALLFLGSGSVIHGMDNDQDMRRYGGLQKLMPITAITFIIGWLAIAGVPPFAGFWSKDEILLSAWDKGGINGFLLWGLGLLTAMLTAFYMSRQVFMTFFGRYRFADPDADEIEQAWDAYVDDASSAATAANDAQATALEANEKAISAARDAETAVTDAKVALASAADDDERSAAQTSLETAEAALEKANAALAPAATALDEASVSATTASRARDTAMNARRDRPMSAPGEAPSAGEAEAFLPETVAARAEHHPHESPWQMTAPLVVLAGLSIVGGALNLPFTKSLHFLGHWLEPALAHEHVINASAATKWILAFVAIGAGAVGILLARATYLLHQRDPATFEKPILAEGWNYDNAVTAFMGGPGRVLFDAIAWFDANVIDGIVNGVATSVRSGGGMVRRIQTGFVRSYALGIALGSAALLIWFLVRTAA